MLTQLRLESFGIISHCELDLKQGLTVLTGETGAGKSIIIDAISLLLGKAGNEGYIKTGCDTALIEGIFTFTTPPKELVPYLEDNQLIIFRKLTRHKQNTIRINHHTTPLKTLKKLSQYLANIVGQHDYMTLMTPETQAIFLDQYAGNKIIPHLNAYHSLFQDYKRYDSLMNQSLNNQENSDQRKAFLQFQVDDIDQHNFLKNEEEDLKSKRKKIKELSQSKSSLHTIASSFLNIHEKLNLCSSEIKSLSEPDKGLSSIQASLDSINVQISDHHAQIDRQLKDLALLDTLDINDIESRLDIIFKEKTKYNCQTLLQLCDLREALKKELNELNHSLINNEELKENHLAIKKKLIEKTKILDEIRKNTAKDLEKELIEKLQGLDFKQIQLEIVVDYNPTILNSTGSNTIHLQLSTNPGESLKPISEVASGGELSRIMLAITSVFYGENALETLIFDEIDTGVGGLTALKIGDYLSEIAEKTQVLCVTHLAQVAKKASHHIRIEKSVTNAKTETRLSHLKENEIHLELKRMVGGNDVLELFHVTT